MSSSKNILFLMSGSISAYKACDLVSSLVKEGHHLKVGMTSSALKFVGSATLEGLTGSPVFTDDFEEGRKMDHIHLMNWAELVIVSPASANTINSMANGISSNVISSLFLAFDFKKPMLLFPAMNSKMLNHPSTQNSLNTLSEWGVKVMKTGSGELACGEVGEGRLLETEDSRKAIQEYL